MQVVSLHCNLDANTTHLMNKERLSLMKKDAILVSSAPILHFNPGSETVNPLPEMGLGRSPGDPYGSYTTQ